MTSGYENSDSENPQSVGSNPQSEVRGGDILRRFARRRAAIERCDMCSAELPAEHRHLVEPRNRQLICACQPCALLFSSQTGMKYKSVPNRVRYLRDFRLTDEQWDDLMVPINMAFFFRSTPDGRMLALYPSPAGPTESLLTLDAWEEIVRDNEVLKELEADVEALLVNRMKDAREYYTVPIDECYKLVGLIRARWRGLSGGTEVWEEIARFFEGLKEKAEKN